MNKEKGIGRAYLEYVKECDRRGKTPESYDIYTQVLKDANKLIRDKIVFESETLDLPYRLGKLSIIKFENKFDPEKQYKWKVDFKKSKELGYTVYYGSPYGYRWKWNKSKAVVTGKMYYRFTPVRDASRLIAKAIKEHNIDYFKDDSRFYH